MKMFKRFLVAASIAALAASPALAANLNLDGYLAVGGHIQTSATPPVQTSCGTSPSIVGSDTAGKFTTGSAATTCTLTFATAYVAAPACILQEQGGSVSPTYTTSATAITVTVDVASTVYSYICIAQQGG